MFHHLLNSLALVLVLVVWCVPGWSLSPPVSASSSYQELCPVFPHVNVFIGSSGGGFGYGSLAPAAQYPYGALRLGPDTTSGAANIEFRHFSGYNYYDTMIRGFSHTRLVGAGVSDLGTFGVMPLLVSSSAARKVEPYAEASWWSTFNKSSEIAFPGYYSVYLDTPKTQVELLAIDPFAAIHKYTWTSVDSDETVQLVFDACHQAAALLNEPSKCLSASIQIDESLNSFTASVKFAGGLSGRRGGINVYLYAEVSSPVKGTVSTCAGSRESNVCTADQLSASSNQGLLYSLFTFPQALSGFEIQLNVGISFVSTELSQANLNGALSSSAAEKDFSSIMQETASVWCDQLNRFSISLENAISEESIDEVLTKMHTAHYRTLMSPTIYSESSGDYIGLDMKLHNIAETRQPSECKASQYFSDLSIWDTFRTQLPWQLLTQGDVGVGILRSLEEMTDQFGYFPRWPLANVETGCMIGMHGAATVIEGLLKGYADYFNATNIQKAVVKQATEPTAELGRDDLENYLNLGYVTLESTDTAASDTLSFAFDDSLVASLSYLMGDVTAGDDASKRSLNYQNVWSPRHKLMCPRSADGTFHCPVEPTGPLSWGYYTEGDAWHWLWFVPHDFTGLIKLFDSADDFKNTLENFAQQHIAYQEKFGSVVPNPYYWAGNEVDILSLWFFNEVDCTRTQYWIRSILPMHFHTTPYGLPGNDDYGTMSAFILFSSLGIYPLPGQSKYFLGSPSVSNAKIQIPRLDKPGSFGTLEIVAHDNSQGNVYVSKLLVNGVEHTSPYIEHADLISDGNSKLEFFMSAEPASGLCSNKMS